MVNLADAEARLEAAARARRRSVRPRCYLQDLDGNYRGELQGELSGSVDDLLNATGDAVIELPGDHHLAKWSIDLPVEETFSLIVEDPEHPEPWRDRWSGVIHKITRDVDTQGRTVVVWHFRHDWVQVQSIVCWANPLAPAGAQVPKHMMLAGPSASVIKMFAITNLWRLYGGAWTLPDPIWDPSAWSNRWDNQNPLNWPVMVMPGTGSFLQDTTQWTVLISRFAVLSDLIGDTLADAQLRLTARRWIPGDPQPAPDFFHLDRTTILLDIVEQSGRTDYTGTIIDGALKYVDFLTEDLRETGWEAILDPGLPTTGKRQGREALPVYREHEHAGFDGVPGAGMEIVKASAWQITHGGKSPGWVNAGAKLAVNSALGALGNALLMPGLSGAFDHYIEDTLLAFAVGRSERRWSASGRFMPAEKMIASGNGFSLSALQVQRGGLHDTRARIGYTASVSDNAPYPVYRAYGVGDRVGVEQDGQVWVSRCTGIKREWNRDTDLKVAVTLGDPRHSQLPEARLMDELAKVGAVARALGVDA